MDAIVTKRLFNQHLSRQVFKKPEDVTKWMGAIQAQDYYASQWGIGLRMENISVDAVEKAYNDGRIVRTHVMRPTWHYIPPQDLRWMQKLTAHRVKKLMAPYNKKLELTGDVFEKSEKVITDALKGSAFLTRQELKKELEKVGIKTDVQRLAHIVMYPELDAKIVSGPRRGRKLTYALVSERIAQHVHLSRDKSLAELATRYIRSHGPVQIKDFSWWSGLSVAEAEEAFSMIRSKMDEEVIEGKTYWSFRTKIPTTNTPEVFLLSIYDEYTIAYKDRSALGGDQYLEKLITMGNALTSVVILHGKIIGTWKRILKKNRVVITPSLFEKPNAKVNDQLHSAAKRYGEFLGVTVTIA